MHDGSPDAHLVFASRSGCGKFHVVSRLSRSRKCQLSNLWSTILDDYGAIIEMDLNTTTMLSHPIGLGYRFGGHGLHSADDSDHFKLLEADGDSLLVGAR
ncbi:unnamed protein product [Angiostrongylus costaricensis]|uniref:LAM_G_DOMAIN domain-containing protein n=1 Tax=Angiostrongylus costaricensis TaxID=334426 RepID=A0A0R3PSD7_ANGCS|nr:unnamed protein product [Angiostrongylus costaricensis]